MNHLNPCFLNTFVPKKSTSRNFLENPAIQIQIYPETPIEPKYGALYLNNADSVNGLVLLVKLCLRVASACTLAIRFSDMQ